MWAKLSVALGCLVMLASGAAIVVPKVLASWATSEIPNQSLIPEELKGTDIDGAINMLFLGMDERSGNDTEPIRADTIMIVHVPEDHKSLYLVSLPRDLEVNIPAFPETRYPGGRDKINAAFAFGARSNGKPDASTAGRERGARLTMMAINQLIPGGITFNGAAIINFEGFRDVLKAIDGVDMCVDVLTRSIHYDKNMGYHTLLADGDPRQKVYPVGCYHMDYLSALDYARQRHVENGDYTRQRHQQQLLVAMFEKLVSKDTVTNLGKVSQLQKAAGGLLTLDLGGVGVADWAYTFRSLRSENLVMIKTNAGNFNTLPDKNEGVTPDTLSLLKGVHDDTVIDFLRSHPDWIAKKK
jgi:LCP family protein required for cell wall assembly